MSELIRYFGEFALSTLQYNQLKVARPSELNDPFELSLNVVGEVSPEISKKQAISSAQNPDFCQLVRDRLGVEWTDEKIAETAIQESHDLSKFPSLSASSVKEIVDEHIIKKSDSILRFLCFSDPTNLDTRDDILMWSHYASSHRGFRLHFDTGFLGTYDATRLVVEYEDDIVEFDINLLIDDEMTAEAEKVVTDSLKRKGKFWDYEKEVRFLINPQKCLRDLQKGIELIRFPAEALTRVDIGINTSEEIRKNMLSILYGTPYQHVMVTEAIADKSSFKLSYSLIRPKS